MTTTPIDRILRLNTVLDRTGLSRATLYRKVQAGTFPKQIRIATRCMGWRESAINDWMRNPMFWTVEDADKRQKASSLQSHRCTPYLACRSPPPLERHLPELWPRR